MIGERGESGRVVVHGIGLVCSWLSGRQGVACQVLDVLSACKIEIHRSVISGQVTAGHGHVVDTVGGNHRDIGHRCRARAVDRKIGSAHVLHILIECGAEDQLIRIRRTGGRSLIGERGDARRVVVSRTRYCYIIISFIDIIVGDIQFKTECTACRDRILHIEGGRAAARGHRETGRIDGVDRDIAGRGRCDVGHVQLLRARVAYRVLECDGRTHRLIAGIVRAAVGYGRARRPLHIDLRSGSARTLHIEGVGMGLGIVVDGDRGRAYARA